MDGLKISSLSVSQRPLAALMARCLSEPRGALCFCHGRAGHQNMLKVLRKRHFWFSFACRIWPFQLLETNTRDFLPTLVQQAKPSFPKRGHAKGEVSLAGGGCNLVRCPQFMSTVRAQSNPTVCCP